MTDDNNQTFKLDDTTIAGLMQLLTLAIATGTNLMDHLRMLDLEQGENGKLIMTPDFIEKTEHMANQLIERLEDSEENEQAEFTFDRFD